MLLEAILLIILLLFVYCVWDNWKVRHGPPGPLRIPIFGTLLQVAIADPVMHIAMEKLAKKYGPVMHLKLGTMNAVLLSSYESMKEVCSREETLGRHNEGFLWDRNLKQNIGLGMSNGAAWVEMRQFCRETLRKYGFGNRNAMEQNIQDEVKDLIVKMQRDLSRSPSSTIHIEHTYFHNSFVRLTANTLMPTKDSYTADELKQLQRHSNDFMRSSQFATGLVALFPFLRFIIPDLIGYNAQMSSIKGIQNFAKRLLEIRRQKGKYTKDPECFTDDFLQKIEADALNPKPFFTDDQFLVVFADLLQAGSDTTPNPLNFTLLHIVCNSDIQEKISQEIISVCGTDRSPALKDRSDMIYTQAVILEGFRWARTVVLGVPKKISKDFYYNGFAMSKGTVIFQNIHTVFFDKKFWGDPNVFRPERFIDEFGKIISSKAERILLFGTGKRNCFGEVQARDSIFLFLTTLIQKFVFKLPSDQPPPSLEPVVALVLHPVDYDVVVELRVA